MNIGQKIRHARDAKKMSQAELASLLRVDKTAISHYECGRRVPRTVRLCTLAQALGLSLAELLEGEQIEKGGLKWGCVEASQEVLYIPKYNLQDAGENGCRLVSTGLIPTECGRLTRGLYIWTSTQNIQGSSIAVSKSIRFLIKHEYEKDKTYPGDIVLFSLEKQKNFLGEILEASGKKLIKIIHSVGCSEKTEIDIAGVSLLGKMIQIALDF